MAEEVEDFVVDAAVDLELIQRKRQLPHGPPSVGDDGLVEVRLQARPRGGVFR